MSPDCRLTPINLSDSSSLQSLVEHRRVFSLNHCELNIYETFQKSQDVVLSYSGLVISSMMRGRKVMTLDTTDEFDFLPGESVILPEGVSMKVGFPDADENHPVQCATIALDWDVVNKNLAFLNEHYGSLGAPFAWNLNFSKYHFVNNQELASSLNKLISISMEQNVVKDALADMQLKLLLMRVIQLQNLHASHDFAISRSNLTPAIQYMHTHLAEKISIEDLAKRCGMNKTLFFNDFKQQFGTTPLEYLLQLRIEYAKKIMSDPTLTISEVCYECGFNSVNYFIKVFKRLVGITPKMYRVS